MKTKQLSCPLCGADDFRTLRYARSLYSEDLFPVVRCRACGMVYINPWEDWAEKEPRLKDRVDIAGFERAAAGEAGTYRAVLEDLARYRRPGRVLDVGCGTGGFLRMAKEAGWETDGVEINRSVGRYAAEKHGLGIFTGTLAEAGFPAGSFDAVVTINTLEHIHEPAPFMAEIARILRTGGVFYAETPNFNNGLTRLIHALVLRDRADPIDPTGHPCLYTPATLESLLARHGFSLLRLGSGVTGEFLANGEAPIPARPFALLSGRPASDLPLSRAARRRLDLKGVGEEGMKPGIGYAA